MFLSFSALMEGLRQQTSVQCYHLDTAPLITGIELFPSRFIPGKTDLDFEKAYICEYRDLRMLEPALPLPPLVCVIEPGISIDSVFFRQRAVAAVTGNTVSEVLLILSRLLFEYGSRSSALTELSHALLHCKDILSLLEVGYDALHNPLVVTDANQKVLFFTDPHKISSLEYRQMLRMEHLPTGRAGGWAAHSEFGNRLNILDAPGDGASKGICMALSVKNRVVGYLYLFALHRPWTEQDIHIMELMGNLLAVELWRRPQDSQSGSSVMLEAFYRDILENNAGDTEEILKRQQQLKLKPNPVYYTLVIQLRNTDTAPISSFYALAKQIEGTLRNAFGFLFRNSILLILNPSEAYPDMMEALKPILPLLQHYNMIAGVSSPFSSATQLRKYAFQSRLALRLGIGLHPDKDLYVYRDYSVYHMIELCLSHDTIDTFCSPELLALKQTGDPQLLETLRIYLSCNRSKTETAKVMFVHVNTIKYRIAQIQDQMHLDLNDDNTAVKLNLSFQMLEYQSAFPQMTETEQFWKEQ